MDDIELRLDEADIEAELTDIRYTHKEVFLRVGTNNPANLM